MHNGAIRKAVHSDAEGILALYRAIPPGGLARSPGEIDLEYVTSFLGRSLEDGLSLVIDSGGVIGEVHASRPAPRAFAHVLSDLTICVHPDHAGRGNGRNLFRAFMRTVEEEMPSILRVELIARESNRRAIDLYLSEGFVVEGRLRGRIDGLGGLEDDIPMAWTRPGLER
jgi:ribosomal protein S18 acetylase RimI-like enzyme